MKKIFTIILAFIVSAGTVFAETVASGTCGADGDNLTWTLDDKGLLTISGSGAMANWSWSLENVPWYSTRSSITSVVILDGVTSIGNWAFLECSALTSITIPNSVTSIGRGALSECSGLISVTIPNGVTSIEENAFSYCTGLTSLTIPNSVTSIASSAIRECTSLTSVTIPNSVTNIGNWTFYDCSALTSITCNAITPPACGEDCFWNVKKDIPVYVPSGSVEAYKNASGWKEFTNIQETVPCEPVSGTCGAEGDNLTWKLTCDGVLTISGSGAMADYGIDTHPTWYDYITSIKEVEIGSSVTNIGRLMFYQCTNLTSVKIGESVKSIGEGDFS